MGNSFIGSALIFAADTEHHVVPPGIPMGRQVIQHSLRALREEKKDHIGTLSNDLPCLSTPGISFFQEKIGCHANPKRLSAFYFVLTAAIPGKRIEKSGPCSENMSAILIAKLIQEEHVAILAAFAALSAAVPWIPNITHGMTSNQILSRNAEKQRALHRIISVREPSHSARLLNIRSHYITNNVKLHAKEEYSVLISRDSRSFDKRTFENQGCQWYNGSGVQMPVAVVPISIWEVRLDYVCLYEPVL